MAKTRSSKTPSDSFRQSSVNNSDTLRVCSYNIHKGFSVANRRYLLDNIRQAIHRVHADILFLQEVVGENFKLAKRLPEWELEAQFEYLADTVWPHYSYGQNAVYDHGHHGNAILSKYAIEHWENHDLSQNVPYSRRGALYSQVEIGEQTLHLFCVHLGLLGRERKKQVNTLISRIEDAIEHHEPIIIAGDFNDWRQYITPYLEHTLGMQEIHGKPRRYQHKRAASTFPSRFPLLSIDRIYFRNLELVNSRVLKGAPWNKLSDHCALYAEFRLV